MPNSFPLLAAVVTALGGLAAGVGGYTFHTAHGTAYLSNDPAACNNCHVMREQHDTWLASSHRNVATCNDCHTPADPVGKYTTKALNGWHHSRAFTVGDFPDSIRITERNLEVTEAQCRHCHQQLITATDAHGLSEQRCTTCHRNVGHLH